MPILNYYDIVFNIVSDWCNSADDKRHAAIGTCCHSLSKTWSSGSGMTPGSDYSKPHVQMAYIWGQFGANAYLVEHMLESSQDLSNFLEQTHRDSGKVRVCVFASGPGTEIAGIAGWIRRQGHSFTWNIDFTVFDINDWTTGLIVVKDAIYQQKSEPECVKGMIYPQFGKEANLLDFRPVEMLRDQDVFIFPYVLSEIPSTERHKLAMLGAELAKVDSFDSRVVFIDRAGKNGPEPNTNQNICAILGTDYDSLEAKVIYEHSVPDDQWERTQREDFRQLRKQIDFNPRRRIRAYFMIAKPKYYIPF